MSSVPIQTNNNRTNCKYLAIGLGLGALVTAIALVIIFQSSTESHKGMLQGYNDNGFDPDMFDQGAAIWTVGVIVGSPTLMLVGSLMMCCSRR